jgi:hypothetical protein
MGSTSKSSPLSSEAGIQNLVLTGGKPVELKITMPIQLSYLKDKCWPKRNFGQNKTF